MKRNLIVTVILGLFSWTAVVNGGDPPAPIAVPDVVKGITARELGGHMKFLASDLMRGRDTTSAEIRLAAEYLASRLSAAGAQPVGDPGPEGPTYFQQFPLEVTTPQLEGTSVTLVIEENGSKQVVPCELGIDVTFFPFGIAAGEIDAPVVFAGYGQVDPDRKIDDFDGIDVKGHFVLVFSGERPGTASQGQIDAPAAVRGRRRQRRGNSVANERAVERGGLGILMMAAPSGNEHPSAPAAPSFAMRGFGRPQMALGHAPARLPSLLLADPVRDVIVKAMNLKADSKPTALRGLRVRTKFAGKREMKEDRNVIGFFRGTDTAKSKEVVIYSAHYDHVGVDEKGEIFNGSDDNASGTSALLEIAEAFGDGPRPARSIAFLWVSGEEKGLLGSRWFSEHVALPDGCKIVADINLDMVSRNDGKSIGITPSNKHPDHSTMIPAARAAAKEEGLAIKFDADMFYGRTDSYNFARTGIPIVFFFCGIHADYHRPTDDFTKADFDKAARVARAAYRLGWQVAQEKDAPRKIKAEATDTADAR